jgi:transcriptional regulator
MSHVARANPVWQEAAANPEALVIFQGPAAYVFAELVSEQA